MKDNKFTFHMSLIELPMHKFQWWEFLKYSAAFWSQKYNRLLQIIQISSKNI